MLVTLLKWQDKTSLLVPMFKHLSFGLVESTRTHVNAHMSGAHKSPGSHVQFMREPEMSQRTNLRMYPARGFRSFVCVLRLCCPSVCLFPAQMPVTSHCPLLWTVSVNMTFLCGSDLWRGPFLLHTCLLHSPSVPRQQSNRVRWRTDGKEISGVVKVRDRQQK